MCWMRVLICAWVDDGGVCVFVYVRVEGNRVCVRGGLGVCMVCMRGVSMCVSDVCVGMDPGSDV